MGNVTADEALNRRLSPVFHAQNICAPVLIGQGGNDVRVTQVRGGPQQRQRRASCYYGDALCARSVSFARRRIRGYSALGVCSRLSLMFLLGLCCVEARGATVRMR